MRAAFLAAFADDGVFVRDGWIGEQRLPARRARPRRSCSTGARCTSRSRASGELGLSTGPCEDHAARPSPTTPPAYGQFVSVWRREARAGRGRSRSTWASAMPSPRSGTQPLDARRSPRPRAARRERSPQAEARFAARCARARRARRVRAPAARATCASTAAATRPPRRARRRSPRAGMTERRIVWTVERIETARSGDFGYARGRYAAPRSARRARSGWYLRVWRREAARLAHRRSTWSTPRRRS